MRGQIRNMQTVARELRKIRRDRAAAQRTWGVYSIKKDGTPYKNPGPTFSTQEEAERRASDMRGWNPGCEFIVAEVR